MYAAVECFYREGVKVTPQWPPLVGQLHTDRFRGAPVLHLWPLDWVENASANYVPLASLWHPVLGRVADGTLLVRGYEGLQVGPVRRWVTQKWLCEIMDRQHALGFVARRVRGEPGR